MNDVLVGLVLLTIGVSLTYLGLRVFALLLPVFCFLSGFFLGGSIVAGWYGDGFLSTLAEWVVGHILGIVFALLAYLAWYAGAILAFATVGALFGMGLTGIFHVGTEWIIWVAAAAGATVTTVVALLARTPSLVIIASTAIGGAIMIMVSLSLIFNQVELREIRWGYPWGHINVPWSSWLVFVVIAASGVAMQRQGMAIATLPDNRWIRADAAARWIARGRDRESRRSL